MLRSRVFLAALAAAAIAQPAAAAPMVGKAAPAFSVRDIEGRSRSLAEFAGKTVVLEWVNEGCPYVRKHYGSGNMQSLQKSATAEGVAWLTIASSAPGQQGYFTPDRAKAWKAQVGAASTDILLDPDGKVGHAYDARTTPQMFVIDKAGKLVYMGGIDDKPYADPSTLKGAKYYVALALADVKAGRPVANPVTRSYGCSVKYSG